MDILALFVGIVLAAGVIWFVTQPLRQARRSPQVASQLDALLTRRESLYTQIREQDFDHATGKVTDADHALLRVQLTTEAADVLRQIDALTAPAPPPAKTPAMAEDVEAAIAARRKVKPAQAASADADIEAAIAARRKSRPAQATSEADIEAAIAARRKSLTCPHCGKPYTAGDAFCAKCGQPLGAQVAR